MSGIPIKAARDRPNEKFTIQSNANIRNAKLTGLARAVHAYLLSLPEGWTITADQIAEDGFPLDSRQSVRRAFRELREARLVLLKRVSRGRGRFKQWYETYHDPQPEQAGDRTVPLSDARNRAGDMTSANTTFPQVVSDVRFTAAVNTAASLKTVTEDCAEDCGLQADLVGPPTSATSTSRSGGDKSILRSMRAAIEAVWGPQEWVNYSNDEDGLLALWEGLSHGARVKSRTAYLTEIFQRTADAGHYLEALFGRYVEEAQHSSASQVHQHDAFCPDTCTEDDCPNCLKRGYHLEIIPGLGVCKYCAADPAWYERAAV